MAIECCRKRRTRANFSPKSFDKPTTVSSLIPKFRMVSIIPGIEMAAPERTDTSSGRSWSPNLRPISVSIDLTPLKTSGQTEAGSAPLDLWKAAQTSVVMVKPGGTESPMALISARLAPLPPNKGFKSPKLPAF
jgi:hypothetical protein